MTELSDWRADHDVMSTQATLPPKTPAEAKSGGGVVLQRLVRLPSKARWGTACNGCGLCCAMELCVAGEMAFPGASAPCPALKIRGDGKSTYCQLVAVETVTRMTPMLQEALGIGKGCSMPDEPDARQPNDGTKPRRD